MRPRRQLLGLRSDTVLKTCGRQVLTYQLAFSVTPVSNGTVLIETDVIKKTASILLPKLLFP